MRMAGDRLRVSPENTPLSVADPGLSWSDPDG